MFSILLKFKRWIKRLLKVQSESRQVTQSTPRSRTIKILLLILASILTGVFYPGEDLFNPLDMPRHGEIALEDVIAEFPITVFKSERELAEDTELARSAVPFVIDSDTMMVKGAYSDLSRFVLLIDSLRSSAEWPDPERLPEYVQSVTANFPLLSESAISQSLALDNLQLLKHHLDSIYSADIYSVGVLPNLETLPKLRNRTVLIRTGSRENIYPRDRLLQLATANGRLLTALNKLAGDDSIIAVELYYLIGHSFIRPNLKLAEKEYQRRVQQELDRISRIDEVVGAGDIIVRAGTRIDERQERILRELALILRNEARLEGWLISIVPMLARIFLVLSVFSLLYLFLFFFRPEIYQSNQKLLAILLVFAFQLSMVYLAGRWDLSHYLFPIAFLPIIVTILFDAEVGVVATFVLALLLGTMHRFSFEITLMTVVVGMVGCFTSREVRKRTHFFRIIFYTAAAYVVFITLVENLKLSPGSDTLTDIGYGMVNGVLSAFLVIGLLPFFESLFAITTDITLLELSDMNHPVLKRLALEAPGTYHHSMLVGNLCESAAVAIGGNPLLARVGAYYHDIGKIEIPEYFVENQLGIKSKHEQLTPTMSSIILASHVKRGRLLGEMYDIPDDVLNFIEEHHGTMVMTYFYKKALEEGSGEISKDKFRYPGPRPQRRETGIAMLADAVEAASRTLEDPKPARISNLIQHIIDDRFKSGELDECPLTLRDLAKIKDAFVLILIGTFHQRIEYPKDTDDNK